MPEGPEDHDEHGDDVEAKRPEHNLLPGAEASPGDGGKRSRPRFFVEQGLDFLGGILFEFLHGRILPSEGLGEQGDEPVEGVTDDEENEDGDRDRVSARTVDVLAHEFAIVEEHQEEEHRGGHEHRGDDLDAQVEEAERKLGQEDESSGKNRPEERRGVERPGIAGAGVDRAGELERLADRPGRARRDDDRGDEPGLDEAKGEEFGPERPDPLDEVVDDDEGGKILGVRKPVQEGASERDDREGHGHHAGHPDHEIATARRDVFRQKPFVDHAGLLEKELPGRDGGSDIGGEEHEEGGREEPPGDEPVGAHEGPRDRPPVGVGEDHDRHEHEIEDGHPEGDPLPAPVAEKHEDVSDEEEREKDTQPARDPEERKPDADADELRHEREDVGGHEIEEREDPPERSVTPPDEFGVPAAGDGPQPDGHLLDDVGDDPERDQEWKKDPQSVSGTGLGVGEHPPGVVVSQHDQNAGADQGQGEEHAAQKGFLPAELVDVKTVTKAVTKPMGVVRHVLGEGIGAVGDRVHDGDLDGRRNGIAPVRRADRENPRSGAFPSPPSAASIRPRGFSSRASRPKSREARPLGERPGRRGLTSWEHERRSPTAPKSPCGVGDDYNNRSRSVDRHG